jgi:hypothetical protein
MEKTDQIETLIETELQRATNKFGPFHNPHEAWAVMHEELEEFKDEFKFLEGLHQKLWEAIKNNDRQAQLDNAKAINIIGLDAIDELTQYIAMAKRFVKDIPSK